jgi:uroporphyrin-III C-methyltransferase
LSTDVALAAKSQQLLSFDGMSKLEEIVSIFQSESKGETPAIIQNGTTPEEKVGIGTIDTIREWQRIIKLASDYRNREVVETVRKANAFIKN